MKKQITIGILVAGLLLFCACGEKSLQKPEVSFAPTMEPTKEVYPTKTLQPTEALAPTQTAKPTESVKYTATPIPTKVPAPTDVGALIVTPEPTKEVSLTPEPTKEVIPTPEPTKEVTPTPEPTKEVTPTPEPTKEVSPTPEPTKVVSPMPEPTKEVSPMPEPTKEVSPTPEPTKEVTPTAGVSPIPTPSISKEPSVLPGWQKTTDITGCCTIVFPDLFNCSSIVREGQELWICYTSTEKEELAFYIGYTLKQTLQEQKKFLLAKNAEFLTPEGNEYYIQDDTRMYQAIVLEKKFGKEIFGTMYEEEEQVTGVMQVVYAFPKNSLEYTAEQYQFYIQPVPQD